MPRGDRKPFGVNVPLMYRYAEEIMGVIMEERVPAVFTSAGSPKPGRPACTKRDARWRT